MSIFETRAPALPKLWVLPHTALSAVARYAKLVGEAFDEAHRLKREAERRYPSLRW